MSTPSDKLYHPVTGVEENTWKGFSWPCLFLGCLWYVHKGMWSWGVIALVLAIFTGGISWLLFPFFANAQHATFLRKLGYRVQKPSSDSKDKRLSDESVSNLSDTRKCPFCAEIIKREAIKCRFCGEKLDPVEPNPQTTLTNEDNVANRELCSDGNCVGVIGADGKCKVCGRPFEKTAEPISTNQEKPSAETVQTKDIVQQESASKNDAAGAWYTKGWAILTIIIAMLAVVLIIRHFQFTHIASPPSVSKWEKQRLDFDKMNANKHLEEAKKEINSINIDTDSGRAIRDKIHRSRRHLQAIRDDDKSQYAEAQSLLASLSQKEKEPVFLRKIEKESAENLKEAKKLLAEGAATPVLAQQKAKKYLLDIPKDAAEYKEAYDLLEDIERYEAHEKKQQTTQQPVSNTSDGDKYGRQLQRDELRAQRDALSPYYIEACKNGDDKACREEKDWQIMRKY